MAEKDVGIRTGTIVVKSSRALTKVISVLGKRTWLYRGQKDASWGLKTGVEREYVACDEEMLRERERSNIDLFRTNARLYGESWGSCVEALTAIQHYGGKTRLLDFSTSMMVSLFMAYESSNETLSDRAVFAVRFESLLNGIAKQYKHYLQEQNECKRLERFSIGSLHVEDFEFRKFIIAEADSNIKGNSSMCGVLPLYTAPSNKRQMVQAGVELMPCNFRGFISNLASALDMSESEIAHPPVLTETFDKTRVKLMTIPTDFIKIVIDKSLEHDVRNLLDQANITPATMYPDIEGLAKSLRYDGKARH